MPTPCSNCKRRGDNCIVHLVSSRCAAYNNRNVKCDLVVTEEEWNRLDRDKTKLARQLEDIEEKELELRSKKLRLRRQLAKVDSKEKEMFHRELVSIDEVRALEEQEAKALEDRRGHTPQHSTSLADTAASPSFSEYFRIQSPFVWDPVHVGEESSTGQSAPNCSSSS